MKQAIRGERSQQLGEYTRKNEGSAKELIVKRRGRKMREKGRHVCSSKMRENKYMSKKMQAPSRAAQCKMAIGKQQLGFRRPVKVEPRYTICRLIRTLVGSGFLSSPPSLRISKQFLCHTWKKHYERPNVGGVSIRSRNGAPSRKGCVVNGQMTKAGNK